MGHAERGGENDLAWKSTPSPQQADLPAGTRAFLLESARDGKWAEYALRQPGNRHPDRFCLVFWDLGLGKTIFARAGTVLADAETFPLITALNRV